MGTEQRDLRTAVRTLAFAQRGLEKAAGPLTLPQYRVLALIASAPERASRLAQRVDVTKATLTGVIDALEAHGWIQRDVVDGDRRGVSLALTGEGTAVLATAELAMAEWLGGVLDLAGSGAARQVCGAMGMLSSGLAAAREQRHQEPVH